MGGCISGWCMDKCVRGVWMGKKVGTWGSR